MSTFPTIARNDRLARFIASCARVGSVIALLCVSVGVAVPALASNAPAPYAGMTVRHLTDAELTAMEAATSDRLGVYVGAVHKGSPAAGVLSAGSIIMAVGHAPVDSPAAAVRALKQVRGHVSLATLVRVDGRLEARIVALKLGSIGTCAPGLPSTDDLVTAYYDLLDFLRTQAWGHPSRTPRAERQRVMRLLARAWPQMDAPTRAGLVHLATLGRCLKSVWPTLSPAARAAQRRAWRTFLLLPSLIYPPLKDPRLYRSSNGSFQYPGDWTGGEMQANGNGYLFLGPRGQERTWPQVLNTATSPAGVLAIRAPLTADLRSYAPLDGARLYEHQFFAGAPGFQEILAQGNAQGAIVVVRGTFPGQSAERFYWLVVAPLGNEYVVARMGGPVAQATTLVPAFWDMLASVEPQHSASSDPRWSSDGQGNWVTSLPGGGTIGNVDGCVMIGDEHGGNC